jgi:oxalate decarboxylase/phosphoglucose isomerase-like protein (cupin superfamily)
MPQKLAPAVIHRDDCPIERSGEDSPVTWRTLISADRTFTEKISCGVTDIPADESGRHYVRHRHTEPEVYYILGGEGLVLIDGTEYPVREGTAVFVPGNALHGMKNTGKETLSLLYIFPADSFSDVKYKYSDK